MVVPGMLCLNMVLRNNMFKPKTRHPTGEARRGGGRRARRGAAARGQPGEAGLDGAGHGEARRG